MCRLLESLKITSSGIENLDFHNRRFNRTRSRVFGLKAEADLSDFIQLPHLKNHEIIKCRVVYKEEIIKIEYISYLRKDISTLKVIYDDNVDYEFKFEDRSRLTELYNRRGDCDDILIVRRGMVTDFSYGNLAFYNGSEWVTPATPLLDGTMRESLILAKRLTVKKIRISDLDEYERFKPINALLGFDAPEQPIRNIIR